MPGETIKKNKSSDFLQADEHSNNNKDVTPLDLCGFTILYLLSQFHVYYAKQAGDYPYVSRHIADTVAFCYASCHISKM